jgi:hypothetical protein
VYATGEAAGDETSVSFQNAITRVAPPSASELSARATRRLLFYARPEPHAARNMFELGVLGLARALREGAFEGDWEFTGAGSTRGRSRIALGRTSMRLLTRSDQAGYAQLLRDHDVGLALMFTPHPSLVPLEMASAGMLTVTNSFENKTREAMAAISANLITAEPTVESIAGALASAAAGADDAQRRLRGATVDWSTGWEESLPDELLDRLMAYFGFA